MKLVPYLVPVLARFKCAHADGDDSSILYFQKALLKDHILLLKNLNFKKNVAKQFNVHVIQTEIGKLTHTKVIQ